MVSEKNDYYNSEHYPNPTEYHALNNIDEERRVIKLVSVLLYIINLAGYELEGRITLRNKKTGKGWR